MKYIFLCSVFLISMGTAFPPLRAQEEAMIRLPNGWRASQSTCFASKMVTPRVFLAFAPTGKGAWLIHLRRRGGFGPDAKAVGARPITLAIDGTAMYTGKIVFAAAADSAVLSPELTVKQITRLTQVPVLEFVADGVTYKYDIAGMAAAMSEVQRCASREAESSIPLPAWTRGKTPSINLTGKQNSSELAPTELFKRVAPSVYIVKAGANPEQISKGQAVTGSAVAISDNVALTNCHVIKGQPTILIHAAISKDGPIKWIVARTLSADLRTDRCLLGVNERLEALRSVRAKESVEVGERVYTIGNPRGLSNTLGDGLVSGIREHKGVTMIQTSAPVSPGSSGGALVDSYGALLGITTFMIKDAQNLNFAIAAEEYWR